MNKRMFTMIELLFNRNQKTRIRMNSMIQHFNLLLEGNILKKYVSCHLLKVKYSWHITHIKTGHLNFLVYRLVNTMYLVQYNVDLFLLQNLKKSWTCTSNKYHMTKSFEKQLFYIKILSYTSLSEITEKLGLLIGMCK